MGLRCFTRLKNVLSENWENHLASVAVWYYLYNSWRIHKSIRMTPAMAAGIADHFGSVRELLETA